MRELSIIIPIYNALEDVKKCLKSIKKNVNFKISEVILIDDASDCDTQEYLDKFVRNTKIKLVKNEQNIGFVKTCNRAMRLAQGELIVLLNSDTIIASDFEKYIKKCFDSDHQIGLASPVASSSGEFYIKLPDIFNVEIMNVWLRTFHKPKYYRLSNAEGFCFCIRREVIDDIGYLDEVYNLGYNEEVDYSYRATQNGWKCVLIDNLYVYHKSNASFGEEARERLVAENDKVFKERWKDYKELYEKQYNIYHPIGKIKEDIYIHTRLKRNFLKFLKRICE